MSETLTYALQQLGLLLLFAIATWGWGALLVAKLPPPVDSADGLLRLSWALATGLALEMLALQVLAVNGQLRAGPIGCLIAGGALLALISLSTPSQRARVGLAGHHLQAHAAHAAPKPAPVPWAWRLMLAATVLYKLVAPLLPPLAWDELMYHLPHARLWADTGRLTVNETLRYPWFPYNFNLLYAASLVIVNDVFTHLIHALAGWTTAVMVWAHGARCYGRTVATVATTLWMLLSSWFLGTAYVELGLTLMVFSAALVLWNLLAIPELTPSQRRWSLIVGGLLLGSALGIKYQAVLYAPVLMLMLMLGLVQRTRRHALVFITAMALPCAYWYVRNAWMTGNPLQPLAGSLFGYTDWNLEDYQLQVADVQRVADGLPWLLWPAALAPWILRQPQPRITWPQWLSTPSRQHLIFATWALGAWGVTASGYSRYLLPAFPVLALLAAIGWVHLLESILPTMGARHVPGWQHWSRWWMPRIGVTVAMALCIAAAVSAQHQWRKIAATPEALEARLRTQVTGYAALQALQQTAPPSGRVYQLGLEDAIYHAPWPMWGDHFGPWRYRDRLKLPSSALACRLVDEGFSTLIVHGGRYREFVERPDLHPYFDLTLDQSPIKAYAVRPSDHCDAR